MARLPVVHPSRRILLINKSQQTTDAHVWDERWVQEVNLKSYIIYDYFTWHFGKNKNTGMVNRSLVAKGYELVRAGRRLDYRDNTRDCLRVMELLRILIVVVVTWMYKYMCWNSWNDITPQKSNLWFMTIEMMSC